MAANVESMFSGNRVKPWHGLGTIVDGTLASDEAITAAGLDWEVKQAPSFIDVDGARINTGDIINYRTSDNAVLGTVRKTYKVIQNKEAFEFTDSLLESGVKYETAGSLNGGKTVFLLASIKESFKAVGDDIEPYLLFSNTHDGTSPVRVCMTNVRVVCQNTLNFALKNTKRSISLIHKGNMEGKIEEARKTLLYADQYNKEFVKDAERLALKKVSKEEVQSMLNKLFPIDEEGMTPRQVKNMVRIYDNFYNALKADDLGNFRYTAWGVMNAMSDMVYHAEPLRHTERMNERGMGFAINGSKILDDAYTIMAA